MARWGGVNQRGGQKFRDVFSGGGGGGEGVRLFFSILFGRGDFFSTHYFCDFFFRKTYITCILILVGALQQHKGIFLKHGRGGAKIFLQCHGGGAIFFPYILEGGGGAFFWPIDFAKPPPPLRP